jgi:hypothetical protein
MCENFTRSMVFRVISSADSIERLRYVSLTLFNFVKHTQTRLLIICAIFLQVGRETINSSDDAILKQDMPSALHRVEDASKLLEEASAMLRHDPYSGPAR